MILYPSNFIPESNTFLSWFLFEVENRARIELWWDTANMSLKPEKLAKLRLRLHGKMEKDFLSAYYELFFIHFFTKENISFNYDDPWNNKKPDFIVTLSKNRQVVLEVATIIEDKKIRNYMLGVGTKGLCENVRSKIGSVIKEKNKTYGMLARQQNIPLIIAVSSYYNFTKETELTFRGEQNIVFSVDINKGRAVENSFRLRHSDNGGAINAFKQNSIERTNGGVNGVLSCSGLQPKVKYFENPFAKTYMISDIKHELIDKLTLGTPASHRQR